MWLNQIQERQQVLRVLHAHETVRNGDPFLQGHVLSEMVEVSHEPNAVAFVYETRLRSQRWSKPRVDVDSPGIQKSLVNVHVKLEDLMFTVLND